jgi:glyceraldehyde 3-phosphate dehydrogenase
VYNNKMENKKIRVAINGFGRIGRAFFRIAADRPEIEVVAVNDLGDIKNLAYLLKHDTVYKTAKFDVEAIEGENPCIRALGRDIKFLSQREPTLLPWNELDIDVVVECTGLFTEYTKAQVHIDAGAKRVVISAPAKDAEAGGTKGETILMGVNEEKFGTCQVTSNASCTTNAASPLIGILDEAFGIEKAVLSTTHAYTASQSIVDGPNKKDFREGRAAAQNIVPSSTGAAIAVTKAYPGLTGLFDGISLRVPVAAGSIVDITFISKKNTTKEEVNAALVAASKSDRWKNIFAASNEPLVSSDIQGSDKASIADLEMTRVIGGNLVKVLAWYDNEYSYTHTLVDHAIKTGQSI